MFRTLLILPLLLSASAAYTLPQSASSFAGRSVTVGAASTQQRHGTSATLEMKRGKSNVPPAMRNQYKKAQEMEAYRQQMMDSQVGSIVPTFNLRGVKQNDNILTLYSTMPPDLFAPILHGHCPLNTSNSTKCENDAIFRVSEDGRRRFTCVQPVRSNATKECKSIILGLDRRGKTSH